MVAASKEKAREYERLVPDDGEDIYPELGRVQRLHSARRVVEIVVYTIAISAIALGLGVIVGGRWPPSSSDRGNGYLCEQTRSYSFQSKPDEQAKDMLGVIAPAGTVQTPWSRNHTFTQVPTEESEEAWNTLMPAYHVALDQNQATKEGRPPDPFLSQTALITPSHVGHCVDYLRQALMCAADTNLEALDKNNHSDGWAMVRTCRDFDKVYAWSIDWANTTEAGLIN
ncbi:hypothetical protein FQN49_007256 [Arthroderma sp. PD_2]|nr:hypothetical protein FQN49_007256 [Arthroderma sp. PD_2]